MLPKLDVAVRRVVMAGNMLLGRCDDVPNLAELLVQERSKLVTMRRALQNTETQRKYWYDLWFTMCREFEAGQNVLIEKIEELQKKHGEYEHPFLDGLAQKGFHDKFVEPKEHPIGVLQNRYEGVEIELPPPREAPAP